MSKKANKLKREQRRTEKAKRKAANRAKYEALRGTSANRKKKSGTSGGGDRNYSRCSGRRGDGSLGSCGNVGCENCFPEMTRATKPRTTQVLRRRGK